MQYTQPLQDNSAMDMLGKYVQNKNHFRSESGNTNYAWVSHEKYSVIATPVFQLISPTPSEIATVFAKTGAFILSFAQAAKNSKGNAVWYVCRKFDPATANESFLKSIKRGKKNFTLRFITLEEVRNHGHAAYADTRSRVGLNDGTMEAFHQRYNTSKMTEVSLFLGAFLNDQLAAFVSMIDFGYALEVEGHFSMNEHLKLCPNDVLVENILNHYLNEKKYTLVSYGFSSIQLIEGEGLNTFKIKCGFEATPIQREFRINPKYAILQSGLFRFLINTSLKVIPKNRMLKKMQGVLYQLEQNEV